MTRETARCRRRHRRGGITDIGYASERVYVNIRDAPRDLSSIEDLCAQGIIHEGVTHRVLSRRIRNTAAQLNLDLCHFAESAREIFQKKRFFAQALCSCDNYATLPSTLLLSSLPEERPMIRDFLYFILFRSILFYIFFFFSLSLSLCLFL